VQLAICWQAGWLAASYLRFGKSSTGSAGQATVGAIGSSSLAAHAIVGGLLFYLVAACVVVPLAGIVVICAIGPCTVAARAAIGGPLAYLVAACFAIPLPGMLAALISVAAAYLAFGSTFEQNWQAKLRWRCAWPIGFVVVAVGGCFALAAAGVFETDWRLAEMASADLSKPQASDADADQTAAADQLAADRDDQAAHREEASAETAVVRQAKRVGLSLSPIIVFLLLIWGLSRLPFVH
jgi:hypothetical protein